MSRHGLAPTARRLALAAALGAGIWLSPPAAAQDLMVGVRGGPENIDPHFSALGTHASAMKHIFDTLVWSDENLLPKPHLAESWKVLSDLVWDFKLRKGVKFHDGSDFTAADVKFSIERIPQASGPTTTTIYVKRVKKIDIIDPHTIHITTDTPAATLPNDFIRLFIVSSKAAKDSKIEDFNSGKAAIGTGPYKYVSWTPKADLVLTRHDNYFLGKPHWAKVTFREVTNDAARVASLLSGQMDLVDYVPPVDVENLRKDARVKVFNGTSAYVFNMTPDVREKTPFVKGIDGKEIANPFRDKRVREALSLAVDRKAIVSRVMDGLAAPANQLVPVGTFGYSEKIPEAPYDPDKAKKLLAEAGYPNGFQVALHCTNDRLPGDGKTCAALGQMLSRIGLKVDVNAITRTIYFPAQAKGEYSLWMNGWGTLTGESSYTVGSLLHTKDDAVKLGAFNRSSYSNPPLDKIIQEGSSTLDDPKRRALLEKAMEIGMAEYVMIPIVNLHTIWAGKADKVVYAPRVDEDTLAFHIKPAK
ncbi:MAG: ABC transporter substrate-binding protein [Alphaproteobacteria bacterium]|nr:ABC transporter substrate-binding protein [Alphaproteobacteria bacterium]